MSNGTRHHSLPPRLVISWEPGASLWDGYHHIGIVKNMSTFPSYSVLHWAFSQCSYNATSLFPTKIGVYTYTGHRTDSTRGQLVIWENKWSLSIIRSNRERRSEWALMVALSVHIMESQNYFGWKRLLTSSTPTSRSCSWWACSLCSHEKQERPSDLSQDGFQ